MSFPFSRKIYMLLYENKDVFKGGFIMSLVKKLLDRNQKMFYEIDVVNDKHPHLKAFGSGAIEGYVDTVVLMFPLVLAASYYWRHKATKK